MAELIYERAYGRRIVGPAVRHSSDSYRRLDTYEGAVTGQSGTDPVWCAGPDDRSDLQRQYDSQCSWCYLGCGHTEESHVQQLQPRKRWWER